MTGKRGMQEGAVDGLALAALLHDDGLGALALPGLAPPLAAALEIELCNLAAESRQTRRAVLAKRADGLRRLDPATQMPPSCRGLLIDQVPPATGRQWQAQAPSVRRGYCPPDGLKAALQRWGHFGADNAAEQEIAAAADPGQISDDRLARLRAIGLALGGKHLAERAFGALLLGLNDESAGKGDALSRPWRETGAELGAVWGVTWRQ